MRVFAADRHLRPRKPLSVGHDANVNAFGLKDRALLNMKLKEGVHLSLADGFLAAPTDAFKFVAEFQSRRVFFRIGLFLRDDIGKDRRGHHRWGKACALFVGPVHHGNRMLSLDVQIIERADDLQSA